MKQRFRDIWSAILVMSYLAHLPDAPKRCVKSALKIYVPTR